jgi:IS5 family transposase
MRIVKAPQSNFGQVDIAQIKFSARSRDDIPAVLKGLQYIYVNAEIRSKVFVLLEASLDLGRNTDTGRPGMELWQVLVLATLKLGLGCDYDRLQELANHHDTLRQMLGHSGWDEPKEYALQTLIDNVSMLRPEVLVEVNQIVVQAGHELLKKACCGLTLKGRCDSFVVETDVHYPTDTNVLWDAMRKLIKQAGRACEDAGISGWRQYEYNARQVKILFRRTQKVRYSHAKNAQKRHTKNDEVAAVYRTYLDSARFYVEKGKLARQSLEACGHMVQALLLSPWIADAERQIDQIDRRVLQGEAIAHEDKVFSIFERHTEWVSKGKAGVPVEFGVRVCVLEDQYQFILHHRVMWQQTDDKVAVVMVDEAQQRYPELTQCSFDKGFHSPANQRDLAELLDQVILPKKGRLSAIDQEREATDVFRAARHQHSAVESCINNLEQRGLDRCRASGKHGFERHVALSVLATNVHRVGVILQRAETKKRVRAERRARHRLAA